MSALLKPAFRQRLFRPVLALGFFGFVACMYGYQAPTAFEIRSTDSSVGRDNATMAYLTPKGWIEVYARHETILTIGDLKDVGLIYNQRGFEVVLQLTAKGGARLSGFISRHPGERIAVLVSGKLVDAPLLPNKAVVIGRILIGPYSELRQRALYLSIKEGLNERR